MPSAPGQPACPRGGDSLSETASHESCHHEALAPGHDGVRTLGDNTLWQSLCPQVGTLWELSGPLRPCTHETSTGQAAFQAGVLLSKCSSGHRRRSMQSPSPSAETSVPTPRSLGAVSRCPPEVAPGAKPGGGCPWGSSTGHTCQLGAQLHMPRAHPGRPYVFTSLVEGNAILTEHSCLSKAPVASRALWASCPLTLRMSPFILLQ